MDTEYSAHLEADGSQGINTEYSVHPEADSNEGLNQPKDHKEELSHASTWKTGDIEHIDKYMKNMDDIEDINNTDGAYSMKMGNIKQNADINLNNNNVNKKQSLERFQIYVKYLTPFSGRINWEKYEPDVKLRAQDGNNVVNLDRGCEVSVSDKNDRTTDERVLDPNIRKVIFKLIDHGGFEVLIRYISTGKKSSVYHAVTKENCEYAIKAYKTPILTCADEDKNMMVSTLAEKEMHNYERLHNFNVTVPKPVLFGSDVLVMEFIGNDGIPALKLKEHKLHPSLACKLYYDCLVMMWRIYNLCNLVHADLSECNILVHNNELVIIDVSQSVEHDHPHSMEFLSKDCTNITDFFTKQGVATMPVKELFDFITDKSIKELDAYKYLEKVKNNYLNVNDVSKEAKVDDDIGKKIFTSHFPRKLYNDDICNVSSASTLSSVNVDGTSIYSSSIRGSIKCPSCQQVTMINGKGVGCRLCDYVERNILDVSSLKSEHLLCTSCSLNEPAISRCIDCSNFLCKSCDNAHKHMRCFENHELINLEDLQEKSNDEKSFVIHKQIYCNEHEGEYVKYYCFNCEIPVCNNCLLGDHKGHGHQCENIIMAEKVERTHLENLMKEAKSKVKYFESSATDLRNALQDLHTQQSTAKIAIEDAFKLYVQSLEKYRSEALLELSKLYPERKLKIKHYFQNIEKIDSACKFTTRLLQEANAIEFLSMKNLISTQLKNLISSISDCEIKYSFNFDTKLEKIGKSLSALFGNIHTESSDDKEIIGTSANNSTSSNVPMSSSAATSSASSKQSSFESDLLTNGSNGSNKPQSMIANTCIPKQSSPHLTKKLIFPTNNIINEYNTSKNVPNASTFGNANTLNSVMAEGSTISNTGTIINDPVSKCNKIIHSILSGDFKSTFQKTPIKEKCYCTDIELHKKLQKYNISRFGN